jgi:para-nitrobenzyl esterase
MKKLLICLLTILSFGLLSEAQIQTGENIAIANTDCGKVRGYISNNRKP